MVGDDFPLQPERKMMRTMLLPESASESSEREWWVAWWRSRRWGLLRTSPHAGQGKTSLREAKDACTAADISGLDTDGALSAGTSGDSGIGFVIVGDGGEMGGCGDRSSLGVREEEGKRRPR